jgi:huntingtin
MVIKALKHYTVTSDVERQSRVLQLLTQLVRLRVNYCLLDSDQIFIGFVLKQLEAIEEGQLNNAEFIIPHIFEFLVVLSYEKNHSKVIIDVPKILQLCEGLAARGEASCDYVVPALRVVAADLFTGRAGGELEAQREVVVSMLLKQLGHCSVMDTLVQLLGWVRAEETGDDRARKLSRQILDSLLPLLVHHQVPLRERRHLASLKALLRSLSPGTLRPCDPLLSALLGCSADLALLPEVLSWIGFTTAAFLTILQLSPEEAVLGRLQELGIMLGSSGSSILETSMASSCSSGGEPGPAPPEVTLATFLLHVAGSAASKLHSILFSPGPRDRAGTTFLEQALAELLLLLTYLLQSGRCPRLAAALVSLARASPQGALHSADLITDLVLQMGHAAPVLTVQWLYVLVLLDRSSPAVWARVLGLPHRGPANSRLLASGPTEQSEPAASLGPEVSRRAALAVLANHLVENTGDGELLAWLLASQIKEIVSNVAEPQVREFITVVHRQAPASGVLLQAISARLEAMPGAATHAAILDCLANIHRAHTGRVLQLLVQRFLQHPVIALARRAAALACRRVELLLQETDTAVQEQLSQAELAGLLEAFSRKSVARRHTKLVTFLNRLAVSFYDLSPIEQSDGRKFNPGSVSGVELDKAWYLAQVKRNCCSGAPPQECARLLANIGFSDIMLVMTAKDFNVRVLEECLLQGITLPDCYAPSMDSLDRLPGLLSDPERSPGLREAGVSLKEGPPLYRAASQVLLLHLLLLLHILILLQVLLQHVKNLVELLPRPAQVYRPHAWWAPTHAETKYSHRLDDLFSRTEGRGLIVQLLPSFARLLTTYPRLPGRRPALPPHAVLEMARLGVLALELAKWLVAGCREVLPGRRHIAALCLHVAGLTFANPHIGAALALPSSNALAASAVLSLTDALVAELPLPLPALPLPSLTEALAQPSPPALLVASSCLARLLLLQERLGPNPAPYCLTEAAPSIVCLARLPQFSALARAPPLAFTLGWNPSLDPEAGMAVPADLLQEVEVLRQVVWRLNCLGWTSRAQFEETWVCLLSVLNVAKDDLTTEEVCALSQSTALVVAAISSLLVTTLALPVAGIPGARLLHHPRDSPHPSLLSGRGQQLTAIQNIIHQRLEDLGAPPGLPVDSSVNLERAACQVMMPVRLFLTPGPGQP